MKGISCLYFICNFSVCDFQDSHWTDFSGSFLFGVIFDLRAIMEYSRAPHGWEEGFLPPIGYMFQPEDEQLVCHYLHPKVIGEPLKYEGFIPELDVNGMKEPHTIWDMVWNGNQGKSSRDLYFFTTLSAAQSLLKTWRNVASKVIYDKYTAYPIAIKRKFCYENRESPQHGRWIMYKYSLDVEGSVLLLPSNHSSSTNVVCQLHNNDQTQLAVLVSEHEQGDIELEPTLYQVQLDIDHEEFWNCNF